MIRLAEKRLTMKNLTIALLITMIISCQPSDSNNSDSNSSSSLGNNLQDTTVTVGYTSMFAVPKAEADANIAYYQSLISNGSLGFDTVRAFTLHAEDFLETIGVDPSSLTPEFKYVRIYLGVEASTNQFKLYMTPVKGADLKQGIAGEDVILNGPFDGDGDGLLDDDGDYLLDFSKPCPATCP